MVLDEIGQVNKQTLSKAIVETANQVYDTIVKATELSTYLDGLSNDEFLAMLPGPLGGTVGYSTTTKNHIKNYALALKNLVEAYNNMTKTGTDTPSVAITEMKNPVTL